MAWLYISYRSQSIFPLWVDGVQGLTIRKLYHFWWYKRWSSFFPFIIFIHIIICLILVKIQRGSPGQSFMNKKIFVWENFVVKKNIHVTLLLSDVEMGNHDSLHYIPKICWNCQTFHHGWSYPAQLMQLLSKTNTNEHMHKPSKNKMITYTYTFQYITSKIEIWSPNNTTSQ